MNLRALLVAALLGAPIIAAEAPAVRTQVYLRGSEQGRVTAGDPLRVAVLLSPAQAASLRLDGPAGGTWTSYVRVRLHDASGKPIGEPATAAVAPSQAQIEITADRPAVAVFRWPGAFTESLPPGNYRLSARWAPADGVRGPAAEASLRLEAPPAQPSATQQVRREFALAMDAHLVGDRERASLLVNRVLAAEPTHADARRLRAALDAPAVSAPTSPRASAPASTATVAVGASNVAGAKPITAPTPTPPAASEVAWATSARASSEYRTTDYGAGRAAGPPDVPRASDHRNAWTPRLPDAGPEWLELSYAPAVSARALRVVQSFNPGALTSIEIHDDQGKARTVWTGPDPTAYAVNAIGVLEIPLPPDLPPVARVRLTLDTKSKPGAQAIDAVGLVRAP